jgi:hypothetical protein
VLLHVADALANPVTLVFGDGGQDGERKLADAVARSTPIGRKRMAGVGSWHAIGDEGRQAMSAVAHTTDSSRTSGHVREVPKAGIGAYSITSVAKPKTDVGISTPSIFAVFMFTTNSNLLD